MRMLRKDRKQLILAAGVAVASQPGGLGTLTRKSVAEYAGCSEGLVSVYFSTVLGLRRAIMRDAISNEILSVIAQGIASGDKIALSASDSLRNAALKSLK